MLFLPLFSSNLQAKIHKFSFNYFDISMFLMITSLAKGNYAIAVAMTGCNFV